MLALTRLRRSEALRLSIGFTHCVKHRFEMPFIRTPTVCVKLSDAKGFQQGFQFEECCILVFCQHVRQHFSSDVVNGVPQLALMLL